MSPFFFLVLVVMLYLLLRIWKLVKLWKNKNKKQLLGQNITQTKLNQTTFTNT